MGWTEMFDGLISAIGLMNPDRLLAERRGHVRIPCRRTVSILLATRAVGGHMLNLSPQGMKVRTHERLSPKKSVRLVVTGKKENQSRFVASIDLVCQVIWCRYSSIHQACDVGLAYIPAPGVDLEYVDAFFRHELGLEDLSTFQKRSSRRIATELNVTCFTPDGRVSLGAIRDLSLKGAMFEGAIKMEPGGEVRLRIDIEKKEPLYCVGTVARCHPTSRKEWYELGVAFTEVGSMRTLKRIVSREMKTHEAT